ncbi:MAG TPA: FtsQ-type POTRA domain-containing protein [Actinomycetota bacterium]
MSRLVGRRRNRRRRGRDELRRRLRRVGVATVQLAALVAAVGWGLPGAATFVRSHPYFALEDVVIRHRGHVSDAVVRDAAGLREGMSIWDVDTDAVRRSLERLPWVRSVRVTRRLPGRVAIRIREHRPAAIVRLAGTTPSLHYVATNGRIFAPVGAADGRDLPYVTGLDPRRVEAGTAVHEIRAAMQALHVAARHRSAIGVVSEIHVDDDGLTVMPMRPAVPIRLGWGDVEAKLARVAAVLPHWLAREGDVRGVRSVDDDEVIVRLRTIPREWGA